MKHINESIRNKKSNGSNVNEIELFFIFGGFKTSDLELYATGNLNWSDLWFRHIDEEIVVADDKVMQGIKYEDLARTFLRRKYVFPKISYCRVEDKYGEVVDVYTGKRSSDDFDLDLDSFKRKYQK